MSVDTRFQQYIEDLIVENPAGDYMHLYTDYLHNSGDPWPGGPFTHNTNCWAYGLDWTGISTTRKGNYWYNATLINNRFALTATHAGITTGDVLSFIKADGSVEDINVLNFEDVPNGPDVSDLRVLYLASTPSAGIKRYRLPPANYADPFTFDPTDIDGSPSVNGNTGFLGKPMIYFDDDLNAIISTVVGDYSYSFGHSLNTSKYPNRGDYFETVVGGDSSSPGFLLCGDEPVFYGSHYSTLTMPCATYYADGILAAMRTLSGSSSLGISYYPLVSSYSDFAFELKTLLIGKSGKEEALGNFIDNLNIEDISKITSSSSNSLFISRRTLAGGANETIDVRDFVNDFGDNDGIASLKYILVRNCSSVASITVGNATDPVLIFSSGTETITLHPIDIFQLSFSTGVLTFEQNNLKIVNNDGVNTAQYDILLLGEHIP